MILKEAADAAERCLTQRAERSLISFIRQAWPVLEPGTPFVFGWHLQAIAEHLEAVSRGDIRNLLINLPPRHCKSLAVAVFWPVWEWTTRPQRRWLYASYAMSLAVRDSLRCRRLIQSDWYQSRWSDRFQLTSDQHAKLRFDNDRGGHRISVSVGGSATGEGGDRVVVDDPHNISQRESETMRTTALCWWDQTMSTRLNDPRTGARVIVMQRLHEKDLSGHVLEQGGYTHLCLPAEFESARRCQTSIGWRDPRQADGELLWPSRIGREQLAETRLRLGGSGYAGQFQQRPAPQSGARFQAGWFRYYRRPAIESEPVRSEAADGSYQLIQPDGSARLVGIGDCTRFAVMDPAGTERSQNERACYTVIQVWDVTPRHEMLLVHQYRRQVQTPDAAEAAVRLVREFDVAFLAVEKDGLGLGVVQTIRRSGVAVKAIRARGSKEARSETAEIRMAAGMIYFPRGADFLWDLEQELLHFPRSEHCDQVDALAHAAMQVQRRAGAPLSSPADPAAPADGDPPAAPEPPAAAADAEHDDGWTTV